MADIIIRLRTDGVNSAEQSLKRLQDAGVNVERASDRMAGGMNRATRQITATRVALDGMLAIGIISFLGGMVVAVANVNDQYTILTNKLVNANSAGEKMIVVQQRVFDIAQRSRTGLAETATLYARIERSLVQYGATASQVATITETVSKAMIVSGATTAEANAAIIQLSQGLQSGTLRGDEFRSVAEQAPRLLKAMADSLGVTTGELRALSMQGKLTADVVSKAIYDSAKVIDEEFSRTVATFGQKLTVANNNLIKFAGTNASTMSATSVLGDGVLSLSENLETVANAAAIVATIYTSKLVSAFVASNIASVRSSAAMATEAAVSKALMGEKVQLAATNVQLARTNLASAQAEEAATLAALQSGQAYYKNIPILTAYGTAVAQTTLATTGLTASTTTLNGVVATTTARATMAAGAMTGLRTALSLLGGPLGIIMLTVGAYILWNQQQDAALQKSRSLATSTDELKTRLAELTTESQKALQVELQRSEIKLAEQLEKEKAKRDSLAIGVQNQINLSRQENQSMIVRKSAVEVANRLAGDSIIMNGKVSETEQQLALTRKNLKIVVDNLASGERGLKRAVDDTNSSMSLATNAATKRSDDLTKALQAQKAEADVANLKLAGNARAASQLADVQSRMPKVYAANKKFIDELIAGHAGLTTVMTNEQLGIKEVIDLAGEAYDAQEKLRQNTKADKKGERDAANALRYEEQWNKAYERVEARGATAIDRLNIQQEAERRVITDKAERAKATQEELNAALAAIDEKYNRQRIDIAKKFNPALDMKENYEEALKTIAQLRAADLLNEQEANNARLTAESEYYKQRIALVQTNAVSEKDMLQALYDPVKEAEVGYARELAALNLAHELKLVADDRFYDLRHEKYTAFLQKQALAQNSEVLSFLQSSSMMAESMSVILDAMGAKNSGAYRAMFAMSKAFAIGEASIKLTQAMIQAMADPTAITPMQKFANYAAVASAGGALVTQIMGATMTGMAHDGISEVPREGTWLLDKGERVLSAQQNSDFTKFMQNGSGGGGAVTINQYFTVGGTGDKALAEACQEAAHNGAELGYNRVLSDVSAHGNISRKIGR